ncbi:GroES-like protein [Pyrenochaeta sp. DS3sAY3a]|nr:GroES-like protein [Pyrenochaeta sp. DS3sAY3a]
MKAVVSNNGLPNRFINLALGKNTGQRCTIKEIDVPTITATEILVKVKNVALNPIDTKNIDAIAAPGRIIGCDFAGTVEKVGESARSTWTVGDRVAGFVHGGMYPDRGAFAEYLKADADLAWKIPAEVSDAEATTFGISGCTAVLCVNERLGLRSSEGAPASSSPAANGSTVFIYGGSTMAGLFSIQIAKNAGCSVITTASPHSFELVKKYGADSVFNYRSPTVVDEIIKAHPNITMGVDCFSEGKSASICEGVLKAGKGRLLTLQPTAKASSPDVTVEPILCFTMFGSAFQMLAPIGPKFASEPKDREALAKFFAALPQLITSKALQPPPITIIEGGFEGIEKGMNQLRAGEVSGKKLVVQF